jgi:ankyrin repeat protein
MTNVDVQRYIGLLLLGPWILYVQVLVEMGRDMHAQDANGDTPLHLIIVAAGHEQIVRVLVELGSAVSAHSAIDGATALHQAAAAGYVATDTVRVLVELGSAVSAHSAIDGATVIHRAAAAGYVAMDTVRVLVELGSAVSAHSAIDGATALHRAAAAGYIAMDTVRVLVEMGKKKKMTQGWVVYGAECATLSRRGRCPLAAIGDGGGHARTECKWRHTAACCCLYSWARGNSYLAGGDGDRRTMWKYDYRKVHTSTSCW